MKLGTNKLYSCSYWVNKLSFCFQLIPFLENSLFSIHITNVTSTNFWKNDHVCQSECVLHQPWMDGRVRVLCPFNSISVISRRWKGEHERLCAMKRRLGSGRISLPAWLEPASPWSEVGSANCSATQTLLHFWKKNCIWFWKKKNCWGRIPGFHLSDKKKVYLWMLDYSGGTGGRHSDFSMVSMCLPFWKPVWLDWNWGIILECSQTYRNNAILSSDFIICQSEQFTMSIHLIFTHLIQMITDIRI